ncbi:MAG: GDP-mannose 4,6-dehydratase [Elusimicrobiota bacterium]
MNPYWKGKRVLVTGAGGFIGSHLAEELARQGARVRALTHYNSRGSWGFLDSLPAGLARRIEVRAGDITDASFVGGLMDGQQVVFHLAALIAIPYSYAAPQSFVSTNVQGTLNVLEACRKRKVSKLVCTSTSEVYGTARYTPMDEAHPLQGQSPYSASKIGADHLAESFHRCFGLPVAIARPFNTYGPRQSARAVLPTVISQALSAGPLISLGALSPVRDFNYVADTVSGFLAVAQSPKSAGQAFNLGSGRGVTVGQAAKLILKLTGSRAKLAQDARRLRPDDSEVLKLVCDSSKARRLLGWKPRMPFEEGLKRTIDYIRGHASEYKAHLYNV